MQCKPHTIQLPSAALAYEKYGDGDVNLVIEMGPGASIAEWRQLAEKPVGRHTVLLYQRRDTVQARKIKTLWQEIMGTYLFCCGNGEWIRAEHSSHYIHLTDTELVCRLV